MQLENLDEVYYARTEDYVIDAATREAIDGVADSPVTLRAWTATIKDSDKFAMKLYASIDGGEFELIHTEAAYSGGEAYCPTIHREITPIDIPVSGADYVILKVEFFGIRAAEGGFKTMAINGTYDEEPNPTFDANGGVAWGSNETVLSIYSDYDTVYLTYDATGKVSGATIGSDNNVSGACAPTYDETGKLVSMHVQRTNGQYTSTFTYDDQGRLSRVDIPKGIYGNPMFYEFTYDEAGVLVKKVKDWHNGYYSLTSEFTYENGVVKEINQTYAQRYSSGYTNRYAYTNDAQGRPVSAVYTTTNANYTYVSTEIVYIYEDLYFFDTTDLAVEENN